MYNSPFGAETIECGVSFPDPPKNVEYMSADPVALNLVIAASIGKKPVPPPKLESNAPVVIGYPVPKTIPPPKRLLFGSGVAVNPQLSAVDPEKVEKVKLGSMYRRSDESYPSGKTKEMRFS